jgi:hypothetical protein
VANFEKSYVPNFDRTGKLQFQSQLVMDSIDGTDALENENGSDRRGSVYGHANRLYTPLEAESANANGFSRDDRVFYHRRAAEARARPPLLLPLPKANGVAAAVPALEEENARAEENENVAVRLLNARGLDRLCHRTACHRTFYRRIVYRRIVYRRILYRRFAYRRRVYRRHHHVFHPEPARVRERRRCLSFRPRECDRDRHPNVVGASRQTCDRARRRRRRVDHRFFGRPYRDMLSSCRLRVRIRRTRNRAAWRRPWRRARDAPSSPRHNAQTRDASHLH